VTLAKDHLIFIPMIYLSTILPAFIALFHLLPKSYKTPKAIAS